MTCNSVRKITNALFGAIPRTVCNLFPFATKVNFFRNKVFKYLMLPYFFVFNLSRKSDGGEYNLITLFVSHQSIFKLSFSIPCLRLAGVRKMVFPLKNIAARTGSSFIFFCPSPKGRRQRILQVSSYHRFSSSNLLISIPSERWFFLGKTLLQGRILTYHIQFLQIFRT